MEQIDTTQYIKEKACDMDESLDNWVNVAFAFYFSSKGGNLNITNDVVYNPVT